MRLEEARPHVGLVGFEALLQQRRGRSAHRVVRHPLQREEPHEGRVRPGTREEEAPGLEQAQAVVVLTSVQAVTVEAVQPTEPLVLGGGIRLDGGQLLQEGDKGPGAQRLAQAGRSRLAVLQATTRAGGVPERTG